MGFYGGMGGIGWGGWLALTLMVLVLVGVAVAVLQGSGRGARSTGHPDPHELVDEAFARGLLTEEEYRRRLDLLQRS